MSWWCHFHFNIVILLLLMTMESVESDVTDGSFDIVEPGQSIKGKIGSQHPSRSKIECSSMCLSDDSCHGYWYSDQRVVLDQCVLIHNDGEENFQSNGSAVAYKKVFSHQSDGSWFPPLNWTGSSAVLYQSFDSSDGFVLMEGSQATSDSVPLVPGKVNKAWSFNDTRSQWVDLGNHTEACMTLPEACGEEGGAISMWINMIDCPSSSSAGIVSSYQIVGTTGIRIYCSNSNIWFDVFLLDGYFGVSHPKPTGWTHIVLNYIGPDGGEGIRIYYNGAEVNRRTTKTTTSYSDGDGRVVVGRLHTDQDDYYSSLQVDELIFFNARLTDTDVQLIYNSA